MLLASPTATLRATTDSTEMEQPTCHPHLIQCFIDPPLRDSILEFTIALLGIASRVLTPVIPLILTSSVRYIFTHIYNLN